MRKVILGAAISVDGYIARANGAVDFLRMSEGASKALAEFFSSIDTVVMGRKTAPATGGSSSFPIQMPTYVFSRSQPPGERDGLTFINESPEALITRLRRQPGKNIFLMGGGELAREFLKADLIDEVSLSIVPVLLGEGLRYFRAVFRNAISFSLKTARSRRDCVASSTNGCGASYERFGLGRSGTCPMVRLRFCNLLMLLAARPGAQVIKLY